MSGGYRKDGRLVCPVGGYDLKQDFADRFPIFDERCNNVKGCPDNALGRLSDFVEHLLYRVLDIGNAPRYCRALRLHETSELAALACEVDYRFLHFRETHLALRHKGADFILCDPELFRELVQHRDASSEELVQILRVHAPLCHRRSVEPSKVSDRYRQSGGYVSEPYEGVIHFVSGNAVCKQLTGGVGNVRHPERGRGGGMDQLRHQGVGLICAADHSLKGDFEFLHFAPDTDHL